MTCGCWTRRMDVGRWRLCAVQEHGASTANILTSVLGLRLRWAGAACIPL
jgi:hypothetical protein